MFPEGSGPGGAGITKTRAKPEIWTDGAKFKKSSDDLIAAADDQRSVKLR